MSEFWGSWRRQVEALLSSDALAPRWQRVILGLILLSCVLIRVTSIHAPALDRTMWKEIDYIDISRNYWNGGFDFFRPEVSWPAEPPRVTAMELPLVPYAAAGLYSLMGFNVYSARLLPLLCWLALVGYVFVLARDHLGPWVGVTAAAGAALMPIPHQFGKILFSEPLAIACSAGALYHFWRYAEHDDRRDGWISAALLTTAVAVKLEPLFMLAPLAYVWAQHRGFTWAAARGFVRFVAAVLVLPSIWFLYAYWLSRTSIDVFGVVPFVKGHDKLQTLTMLSDPGWYREMGWRMRGLAWGWPGLTLISAGVILCATIARARVFLAYLCAVVIYFCIVAEGQIDAPYRQLNAVPVFSILLALGALSLSAGAVTASQVVHGRASWNRTLPLLAMVVVLVLGVRGSMRVFRADPLAPAHGSKWVVSGEIRQHVPPGASIVTLGEYTIHKGGNDLSPVLYYYSGTRGWSLSNSEWSIARVEELRSRGASLLCAMDMEREPASAGFLAQLRHTYPVLYDEGDGLLLDLRPR